MPSEKHMQKAGDNSQQTQIGEIHIHQGITEDRAREIYAEMNEIARRDYTQDAYELAYKRVEKLEELLMVKLDTVDGLLEAFRDPSFQFLLADAQRKAAATEREADYELLSELLVCRVQKGENRKTRSGISRAVKIVDEIDDDALCALTVAHAINSFHPVSGDPQQGLGVLNDLFSKLLYCDLPTGDAWLDHLDVLGAVRINTLGSMKKIIEYFPRKLSGYACVGIKVDSEDYNKAHDLLKNINIDVNKCLVKNCFLDGYVRLPIVGELRIPALQITRNGVSRLVNQTEIKVLNEIFSLYYKDPKLQNDVDINFMKMWDSYDSLKKVREWWEEIPNAFNVSQVGNVLAHTNAKRCDPSLPDLV